MKRSWASLSFFEKFRFPILFGGMFVLTYFGTKQFPSMYKTQIDDQRARGKANTPNNDEKALQELERIKWEGVGKK